MKRLFLLFALAVPSCSKVDIYQPQSQAAPPAGMLQNTQSAQERIVEIDRFLSTPLTGRQDDADLRATLRAERAALIGDTSSQKQPNLVLNNSMNFHQQQQSRQQQQANDIPLVSVAHDSSRDQPRWSGGVEGMVPSERARYFKEIRLNNPNPIIAAPIYDGRRLQRGPGR